MSKNISHRIEREIHNIDDFLANGYDLSGATIQNIDFTKFDINWDALILTDVCFLGCTFKEDDIASIHRAGAALFCKHIDRVFEPYRSFLYTWKELYEENDRGETRDWLIYEHFSKTKYDPTLVDSLYQRIHDHAIDDALRDYILPDKEADYKKKCIGIMGGHSTHRSDIHYQKVAHTARLLSRSGYMVVSGGGPGIMEAANLGAYFSHYEKEDLDDALNILASAPHYTYEGFHDQALEVIHKYPKGAENIAIPTWFYGHEPSNVFASHIAKYFSNSIREDTLLAICVHGILYAPGSAGTTQEIFMDAAQNHYKTFKYQSPMVFLGKKRYEEDTVIYSLLKSLARDNYEDLLFLSDDIDEIVEFFKNNPPR